MSLTTYEPTSGGTIDVITSGHGSDFYKFADVIAKAAFLPEGLRGNAGNVFMAIMEGLDLGLRPMQALRMIDVIKGKPGLKPEAMRALILAAGHELEIVKSTDDECVIKGKRRGSDIWHEAGFTIAQARQAKLAGENWQKYPADMLVARATGRLARRFFADVIGGLPSIDDLKDLEPEPARPTLAQAVADREKPAAIAPADPAKTRADVLAAAAEFDGADPDRDSDVADAEPVDDMFAGSEGQR